MYDTIIYDTIEEFNPLKPTVAIWVSVRVPGCQKLQMTA